MYPRDIRVNSPLEALVVDQALAMVREMMRVADAAPNGQVLGQAESVAMAEGRNLTRKSLEAVLNDQAEEVAKKGRRSNQLLRRVATLRAAGYTGRVRVHDLGHCDARATYRRTSLAATTRG